MNELTDKQLAEMDEAIESLDHHGIVLPIDNSSAAYRRDYAPRWKFTPAASQPQPKRDWSEYLIWGSTIGIILVCAVLICAEYGS